MDKNQYKLCQEVMQRLADEDVLKHVLLIGSWSMLAYEDYFKELEYRPAIRTRDIDLLVPLPHKMKKKVDVEALLRDLDFVINFKGNDGYIKLVHSDLIIEFLVPERGKGSDKPYPLPELCINASAIRYLDFLANNTIDAHLGKVAVKVPHPINFSLHKLIVSERRGNTEKSQNDLRQGVYILRCLIENEEVKVIRRTTESIPKTWRKLIVKSLSNTIDEDLIEQIL